MRRPVQWMTILLVVLRTEALVAGLRRLRLLRTRLLELAEATPIALTYSHLKLTVHLLVVLQAFRRPHPRMLARGKLASFCVCACAGTAAQGLLNRRAKVPRPVHVCAQAVSRRRVAAVSRRRMPPTCGARSAGR